MSNDLKEGDWVVVMHHSLVDIKYDFCTYEAIPCQVISFDGGLVNLGAPLKVCWGKPPVTMAPPSQLVKIDKDEALRYIELVKSTDTYDRTRS